MLQKLIEFFRKLSACWKSHFPSASRSIPGNYPEFSGDTPEPIPVDVPGHAREFPGICPESLRESLSWAFLIAERAYPLRKIPEETLRKSLVTRPEDSREIPIGVVFICVNDTG